VSNLEEITISAVEAILAEGDTFVEVGAYLGLNSIVAANEVGAAGFVVSFEPVQENYEILLESLSGKGNTVCLKKAVSNENINLKIYLSDVNPRDNRFFDFPEASDYETVKAVKLDDMFFNNIKLLKISAQGHEDFVIEGAKDSIESFNPYILVDFNEDLIEQSGSSPAEVLGYYDAMPYSWKFLYREGRVGLLLLTPENK
jgi:FkbM family methyltransferase